MIKFSNANYLLVYLLVYLLITYLLLYGTTALEEL
jgi:hypothetical protein